MGDDLNTQQLAKLNRRLGGTRTENKAALVWDLVTFCDQQAQWHQAAVTTEALRWSTPDGTTLSGIQPWVRFAKLHHNRVAPANMHACLRDFGSAAAASLLQTLCVTRSPCS
jgi:hypothetical protein